MTITIRSTLAASLSATALALLLQQPVFAEDESPAAEAAPPASPEAQPAQEPAVQAQHPAQAAQAAFEERRAARMAELDKRYEELRSEATSHGFEMPPAPPWAEGPQWLSYEEMRELMKAQGVELSPAPSSDTAPTAPSMPAPPMGLRGPDEQKRILETFEQMTPEQQEACFAISRWHAPRRPRRMAPAFPRQPMPQYPPAFSPRNGQPHTGMMPPQ